MFRIIGVSAYVLYYRGAVHVFCIIGGQCMCSLLCEICEKYTGAVIGHN